MNGQIISLGLKKLVLPYVENKMTKKFETQSRETILDGRIERVKSYLDGQKGNVANDSNIDENTHTSPVSLFDEEVATSCIACARAHLATVSASLKEAIRFCRTEGIMHYEVQTRLATAEEEIVALERYDWSPERISNSPPEEQEMIGYFLPIIREIRQDLSTITTLPELVACAGKAGRLLSDYRMAVLKMSME